MVLDGILNVFGEILQVGSQTNGYCSFGFLLGIRLNLASGGISKRFLPFAVSIDERVVAFSLFL